MMIQRQQPYNELSQILSGVPQPAPPTFTPKSDYGVAAPDFIGSQNAANQAQQQAYQTSQQGKGEGYGALGNVGAALAMKSDRQLKTDIQAVGKLDNGLIVHLYRLEGGPFQIGLMADEVRELHPGAVVNNGEFLSVYYDQAVV